jgi:plastocyanin
MSRRVLTLIGSLGLLVAGGVAAVPTALAGGGCHAELTGNVHTDGATSVVRMDVCSFEPTVARVPVDGEVRFLNTATIDHVVLGRGQSWGSGENLRPGDERVARFAEAGVFPYGCPIHPGMVGTIVVGDADTPPAAMNVGGVTTVEQPAAAPADVGAAGATDGATAIEPALAIGLGGLAGLLVLALAAAVVGVRRRTASDAPAG